MSERRRLKKKGQDVPVRMETQPTKIEYAVAKYLKNNVPTKKTKFLNHQVSYFNANKAIDVLLDSPWATGENALFTDRVSVVEFGNKLLQDKFFHRAKKIAVTDKDLSPKELKKKQEKLKEKEKEKKKESSKKKDESEDSKKEDEKSNDADKKDKQKKKKTKIKLDMHLEQVFVDGSEAYVWMYDPIPFWYYIVGTFLLFAAVAICLFPLWPPSVRKGVYYLSIGAAGFLGVILGLAVLRFIIFMIIWVLSLGRHHFWILPNLTEDVGFFASFWPLYHYEYKGDYFSNKKKSKKKRSSGDDDKSEKDTGKTTRSEDSQSAGETDKPETDLERVQDVRETVSEETDSENSNSQTFEIVDKSELTSADDAKGEEEEGEGEEEEEEEEEEESEKKD
ncbi:UNVERIFIED_CONTAM: hypothetical protein RMT77_018106 [Armadillidium vulgare]